MPQNQEVRQRYEHEAAGKKAARAEAASDEEFNDEKLHADSQINQEGVPIPGAERRSVAAVDVKEVYSLLPDFHRDELRRLQIVEAGEGLNAGEVFLDLRDRGRGELIATGAEIVDQELLIPKREVDYEIWDKLIATPDVEQPPATYAVRNDADPFPAEPAYEEPTYDAR